MKNYLTRKNDYDFGLNGFFDDFDEFFRPVYLRNAGSEMKTDIKDSENGYKLSIDMPGYKKEDIDINLENGYVTVSANREDKEEDNETFIRRERSFSCRRSFYVGDKITKEDIKAKYDNGTLFLDIPKNEQKELSSQHIEIQ